MDAEARLRSGRESHDATLKQLRDALDRIGGAVSMAGSAVAPAWILGVVNAALAVPVAPSEAEPGERGCAACQGDPEAHGLHVCGKEPFA